MKTVSVEIRSVGVNDAILIALLDKKPEPNGKIHWHQGDETTIANGVSIRYDRQFIYEAESIAEPIYFTIGFVSGIAGNLISSYIYDKIKNHVDRIKEIKINGKAVTLAKEDIKKAFLEEIEKLEREGKNDRNS